MNAEQEQKKAKTRLELALENARLLQELERLKRDNIIVPKYFSIDEESGLKIYNVEEMTFEFERQVEDNDFSDGFAECMDCGRQIEEDEHAQLDEEGRCVCDDCYKIPETEKKQDE